MFESDADLEAMLRASGGVDVLFPRGRLTGLLEAGHAVVEDVDTTAPRLTCRSSDVRRLGLSNGIAGRIGSSVYIIRGVEPDGLIDGAGLQVGMTTLVLEGP